MSTEERLREKTGVVNQEALLLAALERAALGALTRREVEAELTNPTLTLTLP